MNLQLFIIGLFYIVSTISENNVIFDFGGVSLLHKEGIYYFGGMNKYLDNGINNGILPEYLNTDIYYLNLKDGFNLDTSLEAPWQVIKVNGTDKDIFASSIILKEEGSSTALLFGSFFTPINGSVRWYDFEKQEWKVDTEGSKFVTNLNFPKDEGPAPKYGCSGSTIIRNDMDVNEIVIYGGEYNIEINNLKNIQGYKGVIIYNVKKNLWKTIGEQNGYYLVSHRSIIYKGVLMNFGGSNRLTNELVTFDYIICFDIKNEQWFNKKTSGDIPDMRFGFDIKRIEDQAFVIGGGLDVNLTIFADSTIHILDLKTFIWTKKMVPGLISKFMGSLEHYRDYLIYSFGYHIEFTTTAQIISLKDFTLKRSLPSDKEILENQPASKLPGIIGGSIGGFLGLVILISLTVYLYRKYKIYKELKKPPLPLVEPVEEKDVFNVSDPDFSLKNNGEAEFDNNMKKYNR